MAVIPDSLYVKEMVLCNPSEDEIYSITRRFNPEMETDIILWRFSMLVVGIFRGIPYVAPPYLPL